MAMMCTIYGSFPWAGHSNMSGSMDIWHTLHCSHYEKCISLIIKHISECVDIGVYVLMVLLQVCIVTMTMTESCL